MVVIAVMMMVVIVFGRVHFPEPEKINPMIRVALPKLQ